MNDLAKELQTALDKANKRQSEFLKHADDYSLTTDQSEYWNGRADEASFYARELQKLIQKVNATK